MPKRIRDMSAQELEDKIENIRYIAETTKEAELNSLITTWEAKRDNNTFVRISCLAATNIEDYIFRNLSNRFPEYGDLIKEFNSKATQENYYSKDP
jgi:hypothetical protein